VEVQISPVRKPHQVNPSGIGRKNCGCPLCYQDRTLSGCEHPRQCIETAKMLIDSILPNPTTSNLDLCAQLALTEEEREQNKQPIQVDRTMVFDPDYTLSNVAGGFRIFADNESLNAIPARRYRIPGEVPSLMTIFLQARVIHAGEFEPIIQTAITTETNMAHNSEFISLTFDRPEIPMNFTSALLGGLLLYYFVQMLVDRDPWIPCGTCC
jgi:hypothetical protein